MELAVYHYQTAEGRFPYREWIASIADKKTRAVILARIERLAGGDLGDWKSVGDGVNELRIHFGAGYRVYFGREGGALVILLCGGAKRSQTNDIKRAKLNWKDYEKRKNPSSGRTPG